MNTTVFEAINITKKVSQYTSPKSSIYVCNARRYFMGLSEKTVPVKQQ